VYSTSLLTARQQKRAVSVCAKNLTDAMNPSPPTAPLPAPLEVSMCRCPRCQDARLAPYDSKLHGILLLRETAKWITGVPKPHRICGGCGGIYDCIGRIIGLAKPAVVCTTPTLAGAWPKVGAENLRCPGRWAAVSSRYEGTVSTYRRCTECLRPLAADVALEAMGRGAVPIFVCTRCGSEDIDAKKVDVLARCPDLSCSPLSGRP
jgi:hypothetical protein